MIVSQKFIVKNWSLGYEQSENKAIWFEFEALIRFTCLLL